ncbi:hypothetical protein QQP08_014752, partial [Theobroma cacao]
MGRNEYMKEQLRRVRGIFRVPSELKLAHNSFHFSMELKLWLESPLGCPVMSLSKTATANMLNNLLYLLNIVHVPKTSVDLSAQAADFRIP